MKFKNSLWVGVTSLTLVACVLLVLLSVTQKTNRCSKSTCVNKRSSFPGKSSHRACKSPCITPGCIKFAEEMSSKMDPRVNPCEDFYSFACGNAEKRQTIYNIREGQIFGTLKDLFESEEPPPGSALDKLKTIYQTCLNAEMSEVAAFSDVVQFLEDVGLRGWPHLSNTFTFGTAKALADVIGHLMSYTEEPFFATHVARHYKLNDTLRIFEFHLPWNPFPKEEDMEKIENVIDRVLLNNGADDVTAAEIWNDFASLHKANALAKISDVCSYIMTHFSTQENPSNDSDSELVNCTSTTETYQTFFCDVAKAIISYSNMSRPISDEHLELRGTYLDYFQNFVNMLQLYNDRTIANFLATNVLVRKLLYVSPDLRRLLFQQPERQGIFAFKKAKTWLFCLSFISSFHGPLDRLYLNNAVRADYIGVVKDIVEQENRARLEIIMNETLIDEDLKAKFANEFSSVQTNLDSMAGETEFEKIFENLKPSNLSFIANVADLEKGWFSLTGSTDNHYLSSTFEADASVGFEISLSLGIMYPTFSPENPKIFNIAQLGMIIGHELGHQVVYYLGPLQELENETDTSDTFEERNECFIKQYSQYKMKGIDKMVNGSLTLGENLADSFGITLIEKIGADLLQKMDEENFSLPSLDYTPEELMYIANAQVWCFAGGKEERERFLKDSHSPPHFRVQGPLQNSRRFSEVFNCPITSPMNPPEKCSFSV